MTSVELSPLTRKLSAFVALSDVELAVLERLHQRRQTFVAGRDMVHQGQTAQAAYILSAGWVCSYKLQADGTRQIVDFQVPGDFLGLRSVLLRTSDHSFEPIVEIEAAEVWKSDLLDAFAQTPRLATAILWAASRDEAMIVEHLVGIGRRDADARLAHFLLGQFRLKPGLATFSQSAFALQGNDRFFNFALQAVEHLGRVRSALNDACHVAGNQFFDLDCYAHHLENPLNCCSL